MKRSTTICILAALCLALTTTVSSVKGDSSEVDRARRALADAERRLADAQSDLKSANDRLRSVRASIDDARRRERRSQEIIRQIEYNDAEYSASIAAAERDRADASARLRDAENQLAAAESTIARAKQSLDSQHATAFNQFAASSAEYRAADGLLQSKQVLLQAAHDAVLKRLAANDQTYAELSDKIKKLEAGLQHMIAAGASEARIEERRAEIAQASEQLARYVDDQCATDPVFAPAKADFDQANARRQRLIDAFEAEFGARPETIAGLRELDGAAASRASALSARESAASLLASAEQQLSAISSQRGSIDRDRYEAQRSVSRSRTDCDTFDRDLAAANADIRRATECVTDAQRDRDRAAQELASAIQNSRNDDVRRDPPPVGSAIDPDAIRRKQADDRERAIREADAQNRAEEARRQQQQQQDANRQDNAKRQADAKRDEQQKRQDEAKRQQADAEQRKRDAEEKAKADQGAKADQDRAQQQKRQEEAAERQRQQQEEARKREEEARKRQEEAKRSGGKPSGARR